MSESFVRSDLPARGDGGGPLRAAAESAVSGGKRLRTYLAWAWWVGVAFFAVYPTLNWFTSLRSSPFHLYVSAELAVPFMPQFVWIYLSMYVLFLLPPFFLTSAQLPALGKQLVTGTLASGVLFMLFPAELGFARSLPVNAPYAGLFAAMFEVDRPYNLVPSLHIVFSAAIALACADVARPAARTVLLGWLGAIAVSTILVHQHHVLDVASALALVFLLRRHYEVTHA